MSASLFVPGMSERGPSATLLFSRPSLGLAVCQAPCETLNLGPSEASAPAQAWRKGPKERDHKERHC